MKLNQNVNKFFFFFLAILTSIGISIGYNNNAQDLSNQDEYQKICIEGTIFPHDYNNSPKKIDLWDLDFENVKPACEKAISLEPDNLDLQASLARFIEAEQTEDGILESHNIFLDLASKNYPIANYEIFSFHTTDGYKEFLPDLDHERYLSKAAELGYPAAISTLYERYSDEYSEYYDKDLAKKYLNSFYDFSPKLALIFYPEKFTPEFDEWEKCYILQSALSLSNESHVVFYNPRDVSYSFPLVRNFEENKNNKFNFSLINKYCSPLINIEPKNSRDVFIKTFLPYILKGESLEAEKIFEVLKSNQNRKDYPFLVASFFQYLNFDQSNQKFIKKSDQLEVFLKNELRNFLLYGNEYEQFYGFRFYFEFNDVLNFEDPDFKNKIKNLFDKYPNLQVLYFEENSKYYADKNRTYENFKSDLFSDATKFDVFCSLIISFEDGLENIVFLENEISTYHWILDNSVESRELNHFCNEYKENHPSILLKFFYDKLYKNQYFTNNETKNLHENNLSGLYKYNSNLWNNINNRDNTKFEYISDNPFTKYSLILIKEYIQHILPSNNLSYDIKIQNGLSTYLSSEYIWSNPYLFIYTATQIDRYANINFNKLMSLYLNKNFPELQVKEINSCIFDQQSTQDQSFWIGEVNFYNTPNYEINLSNISELNIKEGKIQVNLAVTEKTNFYYNRNNFNSCFYALENENSIPTSKIEVLENININNDASFLNFSKLESLPLILDANVNTFSDLLTKDVRYLLQVNIDNNEIDFQNYPFISDQIYFDMIFSSLDDNTYFFIKHTQEEEDFLSDGFKINISSIYNEGDSTNEKASIRILINIENNYLSQIIKIILPLSILSLISILTLPKQTNSSDEAQLSLSSTIMLAIIAYQFVVNSMLPELPYLTTIDYFIYLLFISSSLAVIVNVIGHIEYFEQNRILANKITNSLSIVSLIMFISGLVIILYGYLTYIN